MRFDLKQSLPLKKFVPGLVRLVHDSLQKNYTYTLTEPVGKNFDEGFNPELTPAEMLAYGVFEGKYLNDCFKEFPREWYAEALAKNTLSFEKPNPAVNYFKIKSRLSLTEWKKRGWIQQNDPDIRGWFQWYCRYYLGRRDKVLDTRQIKRWRAFRRHAGQIAKNCDEGDLFCRPRQRQALLQWAYWPFM